MDLKALEAWSHDMLVAEGRRRSLRDAELMSRADLVRAILRDQYAKSMNRGAQRMARRMANLGQARELLSVAMEAAAEVLPGSLDRFLKLRGSLPLPEPMTRAPLRRQEAAPDTDGPSVATTEPVATTESAKPTAPAESAEPVATTESAEPVATTESAKPTAPAERAARSRPAARAQSSAPAAAAPEQDEEEDVLAQEATTDGFVDEPIRTHSMARLLAQQGHRERAQAIYGELLEHSPEDRALKEELAAVQQGELPRAEASTLPGPVSGLSASFPDTGDRIVCEGAAREGLTLEWTVSTEGQRRAQAVLGGEGELAIRVVTVRPDTERVVRSEVTEHGPVDSQGRWTAEPVEPGSRCFAAVGLRKRDRFVSIVHACA